MDSHTLDIIAQIAVGVFGLAALLLVSLENKWGFVVGLMAQPFWYITTYLNHQWGIFFLSMVYTGTWAFGCYKWFKKKK
jgi:nicotinamide riboside transporter PnuC